MNIEGEIFHTKYRGSLKLFFLPFLKNVALNPLYMSVFGFSLCTKTVLV